MESVCENTNSIMTIRTPFGTRIRKVRFSDIANFRKISLQEVRLENKHGIVNALCNGAKCYASRYNLKRAHVLAAEAVRQAG